MSEKEWDKAEDATLKALPNTIRAAEDKKNSNPNAKRRLLEIFCAQVDAGKTPYAELLKYLSRQFGEALQSELAAPALAKSLLGGPPNRPPNPEKDMLDEALAVEVHKLVRQGKTELECFFQIAEEFDVTEDVVSHAWRKYKKSKAIAIAVDNLIRQRRTEPQCSPECLHECFKDIAEQFGVEENVVSHDWRKYGEATLAKSPE